MCIHKLLYLLFVTYLCWVNLCCTKPHTNEPSNEVNGDFPPADTSLPNINNTVTYLIPMGAQFCTPNPLVFTNESHIFFDAVFDSSCIYTTINSANQNDINKLFGFSDCGSHHLINSARIGWNWSNDSLRIYAFVHNNGNMLWKEITTAEIGRVINCRITCLPDTYNFEVNGKIESLPRHCAGNYTRYKLYPYFGGDEVAPHDIRIQITEL